MSVDYSNLSGFDVNKELLTVKRINTIYLNNLEEAFLHGINIGRYIQAHPEAIFEGCLDLYFSEFRDGIVREEFYKELKENLQEELDLQNEIKNLKEIEDEETE